MPNLIEDFLQQIGILSDNESLSAEECQRVISVMTNVLEMSPENVDALILRYTEQSLENYYGSAWSFVLDSTDGEPLDDLCDFLFDKTVEDCDPMEIKRSRLVWWLSCYPEDANYERVE